MQNLEQKRTPFLSGTPPGCSKLSPFLLLYCSCVEPARNPTLRLRRSV